MLDESIAFCLSLAASVLLTGVAVHAGLRYQLVDHPGGWKTHAQPTPHIGGIAVMLAFVVAAGSIGGDASRYWPLVLLALVMTAVGALDDRRNLSAKSRVALEAAAAALLWASGLGWSVGGDAVELLLTIVWVVAVVNAMNLLDLMDGVAGTVASVSALGVGLVAAVDGAAILAALAFALAGSCAGFLRHNLRAPSRIYLGDCGSMPIGFLLAGMITALPLEAGAGWIAPVSAAALIALPLFDMALRVMLRVRRGVPLLTAGPDSVANWLEVRLGSPAAVAVSLGSVQGALCIGAIVALHGAVPVAAVLTAVAVAAALVVADAMVRWTRTWPVQA